MALEWEFMGKAPLPPGNMKNVNQWRTPVPGGWMLLTIRSIRDVEAIAVTFYPDPNHSWEVVPPAAHPTGALQPPPNFPTGSI